MSALTNLTSMNASVAMISGSTLSLSAFYQLQGLQDLIVHVRGGNLNVTPGLQALTRLISLALSASNQEPVACTAFDTAWTDMHALQSLDISCDDFDFGFLVFDLLNLPSLKYIDIVKGRPANNETSATFAALVGLLGLASNAEIRLNGMNPQQYILQAL